MKCAFGVESGKFLGFMVNQQGIKANLEKIKAFLEMSSPKKPKMVMSLTDRVATLSRFMSRVTDCYEPFFDVLKESKKFEWTVRASIPGPQGTPRMLALLFKLIEGKKLYLDLVVSEETVSAALVREEEKVQWSIYYVSKRLLNA